MAVAQGEALLGDGFVVRRDIPAGKLYLTDLGTAKTTELAPIADGVSDDRQRTWTVDAYGGHVAYLDAAQRVHIKPVTIPRSPLTSIDARTGGDTDAASTDEAVNTWHGTWQLSRPSAGWSPVVRNLRGAVVATRTGADRSDGKGGFLKAGVKLGTGWQAYTWLGTPGDLTGDGIPVTPVTFAVHVMPPARELLGA
ncbi:hypothetical protein [Streptomyces sp. RKAG293]|uniref:hypothetical protein n=1 Tax=Streptomyces sp. RKAG293 TaxID=2893403 RepID=UPI0020335050|nr:hypothetical protein [Streptomyces sp. RKAG293]MCM2420137.1 hypothetical protein [Streptomyces sp. RKAG293]